MQSAHPHHHPHDHRHDGARLAAQLRARAAQAVAAPRPRPAADLLVYLAAVGLAAVGTGGVFAAMHWFKPRPQPAGQVVEMRVGDTVLQVPIEMKGPRTPDQGREVGMARLRLTWPELKPAVAGDRAEVHITVRPADPTTDPKEQFQVLARFLTSSAWSNPGGLVVRSFKAGSPFAQDELFMSPPDGAEFFARCTADVGPRRHDEGCRAVLKAGPLDLLLRFPRDALTDWRGLSDGARAVVERLIVRQPE
jgi:hypothetical protein